MSLFCTCPFDRQFSLIGFENCHVFFARLVLLLDDSICQLLLLRLITLVVFLMIRDFFSKMNGISLNVRLLANAVNMTS